MKISMCSLFCSSFLIMHVHALQIHDTDALERTITAVWNEVIGKLDTYVTGLHHYVITPEKQREYDPTKKRVRIEDTDAHRQLIVHKVAKAVENVPVPSEIFMTRAERQATGWVPGIKRLWAYYLGTREQTHNSTELRALITRIMTTYFTEFLLKSPDKKMNWCTCVSEPRRMALVVCMAVDARNTFAGQVFTKDAPLIYTSFASGTLMQDYLLISELLETFHNLQINLIDLAYPDVLTLKAVHKKEEELKKQGLRARAEHLDTLAEFADHAKAIDTFKVRIGQLVSLKKGTDYSVEVTPYDNSYQYIEYARRNSNEKSHILYLTDPNVGHGADTSYPSAANVVDIWIDEHPESEILTLYMPRHHPVQLYELMKEYALLDKRTPSKQFIDAKYQATKELMHLIRTLGAQKSYSSRLLMKLLAHPMAHEQVTPDVLRKLGFVRIAAAWEYQKDPNNQHVGVFIPDEIRPYRVGGIPVLMTLGADPHVSFQDLVWDALQPNAIAYKLYITDVANVMENVSEIIKVDVAAHKAADVIGKLGGGGQVLALFDAYRKRRVM